MKRKIRQPQKICHCEELKYVPQGWMQPPSRFSVVDFQNYKIQQQKVILDLYCNCGKRVGQIIYAGKQDIGKWRVNQPKNPETIMNKLQQWLCFSYIKQFDNTGSKMLQISQKTLQVNQILSQI